MSEMSDEKSPPPPETWTYTLGEFIHFLTMTKRHTSCPCCPYSGTWLFHADGNDEFAMDSKMLVFVTPAFKPEDIKTVHVRSGHLQMECPACGFVVCTSTSALAKFFDRVPSGEKP